MSTQDDGIGQSLWSRAEPPETVFRYLATLKGCNVSEFLKRVSELAEEIEAVSESEYQAWTEDEAASAGDFTTRTTPELHDLLDTIDNIPQRAGRERTTEEMFMAVKIRDILAARAKAEKAAGPPPTNGGGPS